jgi:hypothetical protein
MFIDRKFNQTTSTVELWKCEWEYSENASAKKVFICKVGEEQPLAPLGKNTWSQATAVCWASGRTLGNIAVFSKSILGSFPAQAGDDASLPCDFVHAGKFRHGADRWWCRTHQVHWGTKADHQSYDRLGVMRCANHLQLLNYTLVPLEINTNNYAEVGIWCSLPAALSPQPNELESRTPKIHVHLRPKVDGEKEVDSNFDAVSLLYRENLGLFSSDEITRVNITPPAAFEFMRALEEEREMTCINCSKCGYPHLDLGDFARKPHRKHFCGNCGCDNTWSSDPIVSTPLKPLHDQLAKNTQFMESDRAVNLDQYSGCNYTIWASTPAILWTADRPQEKGIHVHVNDGIKRIIDETFGVVVLNGNPLQREKLLQAMFDRTVI